MQQLYCSCRRFLIIIGLTILTVSYTFLGAYIFTAVDNHELSSEQRVLLFDVDNMKNDTTNYILDVVMITGELRELNRGILWSSVRENIDELTVKLLNTYENKDIKALQKNEFSFEESLFFSFSLLTTIGETFHISA